MKNVILFLVVILLLGCKGKVKISEPVYPKFVKNKCTNQWAIVTAFYKTDNEYLYLGSHDKTNDILESRAIRNGNYWSIRMPMFGDPPKDYAIDGARIGAEYNYDDSLKAVKAWNEYFIKAEIDRKNAEAAQKAAQLAAIENKRYADSIFKCNHTYDIK